MHLTIFSLLLLFTLTSAVTFMEAPMSMNVTNGTEAEFYCKARGITMAWMINGTAASNTDDIASFTIDLPGNGVVVSTLFISSNITYNNTKIVCQVFTEEGVMNQSDPAILRIQGPPDAVMTFTSELSNGQVYLTWIPPFTLDLTDIDVDIYFDIFVSVDSGHNLNCPECPLNMPEYTFPTEGSLDPCSNYSFSVEPFNDAGRGPAQLLSGVHTEEPVFSDDPEFEFVVSPVLKFVAKVLNAESICTAFISLGAHSINGDTIDGQWQFVPGTEIGIQLNMLYSVILTASNIGGSNSRIMTLSTYDLQGATIREGAEPGSINVIDIKFAVNSSAIGFFMVVVNGSGFAEHFEVLMKSNSVSPAVELSEGPYHVTLYDVENDGEPQTSAAISANITVPQWEPLQSNHFKTHSGNDGDSKVLYRRTVNDTLCITCNESLGCGVIVYSNDNPKIIQYYIAQSAEICPPVSAVTAVSVAFFKLINRNGHVMIDSLPIDVIYFGRTGQPQPPDVMDTVNPLIAIPVVIATIIVILPLVILLFAIKYRSKKQGVTTLQSAESAGVTNTEEQDPRYAHLPIQDDPYYEAAGDWIGQRSLPTDRRSPIEVNSLIPTSPPPYPGDISHSEPYSFNAESGLNTDIGVTYEEHAQTYNATEKDTEGIFDSQQSNFSSLAECTVPTSMIDNADRDCEHQDIVQGPDSIDQVTVYPLYANVPTGVHVNEQTANTNLHGVQPEDEGCTSIVVNKDQLRSLRIATSLPNLFKPKSSTCGLRTMNSASAICTATNLSLHVISEETSTYEEEHKISSFMPSASMPGNLCRHERVAVVEDQAESTTSDVEAVVFQHDSSLLSIENSNTPHSAEDTPTHDSLYTCSTTNESPLRPADEEIFPTEEDGHYLSSSTPSNFTCEISTTSVDTFLVTILPLTEASHLVPCSEWITTEVVSPACLVEPYQNLDTQHCQFGLVIGSRHSDILEWLSDAKYLDIQKAILKWPNSAKHEKRNSDIVKFLYKPSTKHLDIAIQNGYFGIVIVDDKCKPSNDHFHTAIQKELIGIVKHLVVEGGYIEHLDTAIEEKYLDTMKCIVGEGWHKPTTKQLIQTMFLKCLFIDCGCKAIVDVNHQDKVKHMNLVVDGGCKLATEHYTAFQKGELIVTYPVVDSGCKSTTEHLCTAIQKSNFNYIFNKSAIERLDTTVQRKKSTMIKYLLVDSQCKTTNGTLSTIDGGPTAEHLGAAIDIMKCLVVDGGCKPITEHAFQCEYFIVRCPVINGGCKPTLYTAIQRGHLDIVRFLVHYGYKPITEHLNIGIQSGCCDIVKCLVVDGRFTPAPNHLSTVVQRGCFNILKCLVVDSGCKLSTEHLYTELHFDIAHTKLYNDLVKCLVVDGGCIKCLNVRNHLDIDGGYKPTTEYLLMTTKQLNIVELLIKGEEYGKGNTTLHLACHYDFHFLKTLEKCFRDVCNNIPPNNSEAISMDGANPTYVRFGRVLIKTTMNVFVTDDPSGDTLTKFLQKETLALSHQFSCTKNLQRSEEEPEQSILRWLSFLNNQYSSVHDKLHLITVIDSHTVPKVEDHEQKYNILKAALSDFSSTWFEFTGFIPMNYHHLQTLKLTHQLNIGYEVLRVVVLFTDKFSECPCITLQHVKGKTLLVNFISLFNMLEQLHDRKPILFLQKETEVEDIDKESLVTDTVFTHKEFKLYCKLTFSTGVVPLSETVCSVIDHNLNMLISFFSHLEYCSEICDVKTVELIEANHQSLRVSADSHQGGEVNSNRALSSRDQYDLLPGLNYPDQVYNIESWISFNIPLVAKHSGMQPYDVAMMMKVNENRKKQRCSKVKKPKTKYYFTIRCLSRKKEPITCTQKYLIKLFQAKDQREGTCLACIKSFVITIQNTNNQLREKKRWKIEYVGMVEKKMMGKRKMFLMKNDRRIIIQQHKVSNPTMISSGVKCKERGHTWGGQEAGNDMWKSERAERNWMAGGSREEVGETGEGVGSKYMKRMWEWKEYGRVVEQKVEEGVGWVTCAGSQNIEWKNKGMKRVEKKEKETKEVGKKETEGVGKKGVGKKKEKETKGIEKKGIGKKKGKEMKGIGKKEIMGVGKKKGKEMKGVGKKKGKETKGIGKKETKEMKEVEMKKGESKGIGRKKKGKEIKKKNGKPIQGAGEQGSISSSG